MQTVKKILEAESEGRTSDIYNAKRDI